MIQEYDKLVRDNIPNIIEENGEKPITDRVDGNEYASRLTEKLEEEVEEYRESGKIDELADVLEVLRAICKNRGVPFEKLQEKRAQKAEERGQFDRGVILKRVEK